MGIRTEKMWNRLDESRIAGHISAAALLTSYPVLVAAALWPNVALFAAVAVVSYFAEGLSYRLANYLITGLTQVSLGVTLRFLLREFALLVLLIRLGHGGTAWFAAFTLVVVSLHAARGAHTGLTLYVTRRRRLPAFTRRLDLSALKIPDAPPRLLAPTQARTTLYLDILAVTGGVVTAATGLAIPALGGAGLALALSVVAVDVMVPYALRARRLGNVDRVFAVVNKQLKKLSPQVVLYFSGPPESAYQINMWLSTLDRLDRPAVIILRERAMIPLLARTTTPIVCVPAIQHMPLLELSSVRVALFPANASKNLHMLRIPEIKSVFINHGDSDKAASFNPFSKVYNQIWVAGPAGRDRYLRAEIGVHNEEMVEVGRPQLAPIHAGRETPDPMLTVLYAPTWEGWTGDPFHTSVALMGPAIVRALLDHLPHIRLLYKPHPLTGKDDVKVRQAHEKIVAMIQQANRSREASKEWADSAAKAAAAQAARQLGDLTKQLAAYTDTETGNAWRRVVSNQDDDAQLSRDSRRPDADANAAWERTFADWHETFWASEGWWRHRVITGPNPHLYQCFNRCDLLITDISSVVVDFLASGKPYVVTNPGQADEAEFRRENPTVEAAYLLSRDCAELPDILTEAEKDGPDRLTAQRRELRGYLLGPDQPDALTRFKAAVDAVVKGAEQGPRHDGDHAL